MKLKYIKLFEEYNYQELVDRVDVAYQAFVKKDEELFNDPRCEITQNPFSRCTHGAVWLKNIFFPEAEIMGYDIKDNPTAKIGTHTHGHAFLVLDNRYIIDFWYRVIQGQKEAPILLDMETQKDLVKELYGDPKTWDLHPPLSEYMKSIKDDPFDFYIPREGYDIRLIK